MLGLNLSGIPFIGGMFPNPNAGAMSQGFANAAQSYADRRMPTAAAYQQGLQNALTALNPAANALNMMYGGMSSEAPAGPPGAPPGGDPGFQQRPLQDASPKPSITPDMVLGGLRGGRMPSPGGLAGAILGGLRGGGRGGGLPPLGGIMGRLPGFPGPPGFGGPGGLGGLRTGLGVLGGGMSDAGKAIPGAFGDMRDAAGDFWRSL